MTPVIPAILRSDCDPFLTAAALAMAADDVHRRRELVERLLELRALASHDLRSADRAERLFAMGCLHLVLAHHDHRGASGPAVRATPASLRFDTRSRTAMPAAARNDGRRASGGRRRNVRGELRSLFAAMRVLGQVGCMDHGPGLDSAVPERRLERELWRAMLDDGLSWQVDPVFCDQLDELLVEPSSRRRSNRGPA